MQDSIQVRQQQIDTNKKKLEDELKSVIPKPYTFKLEPTASQLASYGGAIKDYKLTINLAGAGKDLDFYLRIDEDGFRSYQSKEYFDEGISKTIKFEDLIEKITTPIAKQKELDKIRQEKIENTNWKSAGITLEKKLALDQAKAEIGQDKTKPGTFKIVNPEPGKLFIVAKAEVDGGPKTEVRVYQATVDEDGIRVYTDKAGKVTKNYSNFPSPKELKAQLEKHLTPKILSLKDVTQREIKQKKEIFLLSLDFDDTLVHGHLHATLSGKNLPYGYPDKKILEEYYQKYGFKQEGLIVDKMLEVLQQNKKGDKEIYVLINSTSRYPGGINFFVDKLKDKILEKGKNQGITRAMVDKLFLYKAPDLFTEPKESPEETLVKDNKGQITKFKAQDGKDGYRGKSNPIFETMIEIGATKPGNVLHMDDDADIEPLLKAEIPEVKTVKAPETTWDNTQPDKGRIPIEPDPKYLKVAFTNNFNAMLRGESLKDNKDSYLKIFNKNLEDIKKDPNYSPSKPQSQLGAYTFGPAERKEDGSYLTKFSIHEGTVTQYSLMEGEHQKANKTSAGYIVIDNEGFHYRDSGGKPILNKTRTNTFDNIGDLMKFAWVDLEMQRVAARNEERRERGQPLVQDTPRELPKALAEALQVKPEVSPTSLSAAPSLTPITPMLDLHKAKTVEPGMKQSTQAQPTPMEDLPPAQGPATIKRLTPPGPPRPKK